MADFNFTNRELMQCAQREVGQRQWVYKRRVADGKLTEAAANKELAMMTAISLHFGRLAAEDDRRDKPTLL